jgi:hypothetical protein
MEPAPLVIVSTAHKEVTAPQLETKKSSSVLKDIIAQKEVVEPLYAQQEITAPSALQGNYHAHLENIVTEMGILQLLSQLKIVQRAIYARDQALSQPRLIAPQAIIAQKEPRKKYLAHQALIEAPQMVNQ